VCRFDYEKFNCHRRTRAMENFSETILDLGLMDLPLRGAQYTWSRGTGLLQASRIDRFLISSEWNDSFKTIKQVALPRVISDHKPLMLECGEWDSSSSYFKFENMWLQAEGFLDSVKNWWSSYEVEGSPDFVLVQKLKYLKKDISTWNKEVFGKLEEQRSQALNDLTNLEQSSEGRILSEAENAQMINLQTHLEQLAKIEEVSWRQKSRCLWLKDGDRNTKYFQSVANANRRYNCIDKLKIAEHVIEDKREIKEEILSYYQHLYTENEPWRPSARFENLARISEAESTWLEREFEEEEIFSVIKSCAPDKAPGPDGFTMAFFQHAWEIIKYEIIKALRHYHQHCHMVKSVNATFISLIPKKKGAIELRDYRPISLISSIYKITSKLLANRLKTVIGKLVSGSQNAFVRGRQISDAALIANEALDWKIKSGEPGLLVKLDIEKAFDKVSWSYLLTILRQMGFGERWIRWMKFSITTVKYSILVNRSPVGFFPPQRGIRQGDPISPFLFILAMEGLSKMIQKASSLHWIEPFKIGRDPTSQANVSHLLYADDTLIFCGAERSQVMQLNLTLFIFEAISGLHMNMQKSTIYPVNEVLNLEELADIMGCNIGSFPSTYLGLPLGAQHKSTEIWTGVIGKFEKRLATWQMQYLSFGGRVTLINSVLDSLPTYYMALLPMPSEVIEQIDKIRRDFLWKGNREKHKFHLIKWEKVTQPKYQGGLGIKNLAAHNKSMMMKWLWRYNLEDAGLWKEVIIAKHGRLNQWCSNITTLPYGVGLWKSIRMLWDTFDQNAYFELGNGLLLKFWTDKWLGNTTLQEDFPDLFRIAQDPNSVIAANREGINWDLRFRRNMHDWEVNDLVDLFARLQHCHINLQAADKLKWGHQKGVYTVKEGYQQLCSRNPVIANWPWKLIWRTKLPPKVVFFTWIALYEACLTQDNIKKRKIQFPNRCYMCKKEAETPRHLLLHCEVASELWSMFFCLSGINWTTPLTVKDAYESWSLWKVDKAIKKIWIMIPACIFWCIWLERNKRCFDGESTALGILKTRCTENLFSWTNLYPAVNAEQLQDFTNSLALA